MYRKASDPHHSLVTAMTDNATIIVAVISLTGTLLVVIITVWSNFYSDKRKRLSETEKLVKKYHDPLLFAAQDLQSRLYNITAYNNHLLGWMYSDERRKENLSRYTCFLVGQYLSWTYILRRQTQFLLTRKTAS